MDLGCACRKDARVVISPVQQARSSLITWRWSRWRVEWRRVPGRVQDEVVVDGGCSGRGGCEGWRVCMAHMSVPSELACAQGRLPAFHRPGGSAHRPGISNGGIDVGHTASDKSALHHFVRWLADGVAHDVAVRPPVE